MTQDTKVSEFTESTSVLYTDAVPFIYDPSGSPRTRRAQANNFFAGPGLVVAASNAPANWKKHADYVCTGAADDVNIQAAIDALLASYQGTVSLSPGLFTCSGTIDISGNEHVTLQGQGAMSTKLNFTVAGKCITVGNATDSGTQGAMLRDFRITGDATNTTYGVYCNNLAYCNFRDLFIESMTEYGFYLTNASQCYVENVRAKNCVTADFYSAQTAGGFYNCIAHGLTSGDGFYIHSSGTLYSGCIVDHVGAVGYNVVGSCDMVYLIGCHAEGSVGSALVIDKGAGSYVKAVTVMGGCFSIHTGATATSVIDIGDCDNVILIGPTVAAVPVITGINVQAAADQCIIIQPYFSGSSPLYAIASGADVSITDRLAASAPRTQNQGAAATVADGGTITHGLWTTPTYVLVTPSVADEYAAVTALGATTFTVALTKHDGTAGTTQTVYWRAEV